MTVDIFEKRLLLIKINGPMILFKTSTKRMIFQKELFIYKSNLAEHNSTLKILT